VGDLPDIFTIHGNEIIRSRIADLEAQMLQQPQVELKTSHTFGGGMYARTIEIPAGTLLTGEIHKFEHLNIVSKGRISVLTENGVQHIEAPCIMASPPGTKRVGYAHEDTVWTTIHATEETNVDKIREIFIAKDHSEVELLPIEALKLEGE
jgi:hypothetical protein